MVLTILLSSVLPNLYILLSIEILLKRSKCVRSEVNMVEKNYGKTELVYLKRDLFEMAEAVRKELGLSRSGFYRYCILRTLDSMSVLSTKLKEKLSEEVMKSGT